MAVSTGGQDAFNARVKRIAKAQGQTTVFIGMEETSSFGGHHNAKKPRGKMLCWGVLAAVMATPAAAYANGFIDVSPSEVMNLASRLSSHALSLLENL